MTVEDLITMTDYKHNIAFINEEGKRATYTYIPPEYLNREVKSFEVLGFADIIENYIYEAEEDGNYMKMDESVALFIAFEEPANEN
ncbi:hypothetical protein NE261_05425 [Enterococcus italicus]|uniref:hypothetical protein n=1 Tax=Enterococcus italicus TaxID=246144 RepID=UPI0020734C3E|nr:hypothetical protein [Enterococcus italicus]MCM6931250.1 hypothetical protein [Enterococcus italicus]